MAYRLGRRIPREREGHYHVFNQYTIRLPAPVRHPPREYLTSRQIGTEIYYPLPLHLQACFAELGYREGDMPESERASKEALAIPIYPEIGEAGQLYVVDMIARFFDGRS